MTHHQDDQWVIFDPHKHPFSVIIRLLGQVEVTLLAIRREAENAPYYLQEIDGTLKSLHAIIKLFLQGEISLYRDIDFWFGETVSLYDIVTHQLNKLRNSWWLVEMLMRIHIIDAPNLGENPTAKRLIAQYEMLLKQLQQYAREHHDAIEIIPPPSLSDEWDEL